MEEQIEANIHTTFGGAGGEQAAATDAELKSKYHLTDDQLFYVAEASHKFYQTYLSGRFLAFSNNPLNCTSTPMGIRDSGTLGADAAPRCACNDYYFESESNTNQVRSTRPPFLCPLYTAMGVLTSAPFSTVFRLYRQLVNLYFNHLMDGDTSILDHDWETKKGTPHRPAFLRRRCRTPCPSHRPSSLPRCHRERNHAVDMLPHGDGRGPRGVWRRDGPLVLGRPRGRRAAVPTGHV